MAVEEAVAVHRANVQRVTAVEVRIFCHQSYRRTSLNPFVLLQASLETITSAESIPHRDGPIQILEKSLPTMDSRTAQLQEFAEGIARLIKQAPVVRGEINTKAENEPVQGVRTGFAMHLERRNRHYDVIDIKVLVPH